MKKEYSAGIIVFYDLMVDDQIQRIYLILHYPRGHWDLPKGKLEKDETNMQAAIREVKEETGLEVTIIPGFEQSLSYMFKDQEGHLVQKTVTFFVGKSSTTDVSLSHEHINYQWLSLRDALKQVTYVNARQLLSMADQFLSGLESSG